MVGTELFNAAASGSIEALTAAELLARMAARSKEPVMLRRLAGVLLLRGHLDRLHGDEDAAASTDAEALVTLDTSADLGDEHAVGLLVELREQMPGAGFDLLRQRRRRC